jgi:hypothetical protein
MPSLHKAKLLLAKLGLAAKQQGRQQGDAAAPIQLQAGFDIERAVARVEQRLADLWSDARRRNTPSLPQAKQSAVQPAAAQPLQLQQVLGTNGVLRVGNQAQSLPRFWPGAWCPTAELEHVWVHCAGTHIVQHRAFEPCVHDQRQLS